MRIIEIDKFNSDSITFEDKINQIYDTRYNQNYQLIIKKL